MRRPSKVVALLFGMSSIVTCVAQTSTSPNSFDPYVGIYRLKTNGVVSIAKYDLGDGQNRLLFTDFKSGVIRILSPSSENSFTAGTGLLVNPPVEMQISFARNGRNQVTSFVWQQNGSARRVADKVNLRREAISFRNGEVTLSWTLVTPKARRCNPPV